MEKLLVTSREKVHRTRLEKKRYLLEKMPFSSRLTGIRGARGSGKTTLMLQYAKEFLDPEKVLYASLDNIYFRRNSLYSVGESFVTQGGEYLMLDEVHRYNGWAQEIKNLYDDFPNLKMLFTGSSPFHLSQYKADLSRRAVIYDLHLMSFREFLSFVHDVTLPVIPFEEVLKNHVDIALEISEQINPIPAFKDYLQWGSYPYFLESKELYLEKLATTINQALEIDLASIHEITYATIDKVKKLLAVISESPPFTPNISKISTHIETTRNRTVEFLHFLYQIFIISMLHKQGKGWSRMQKPDKILLSSPNMYHALAPQSPSPGSTRESFFVSQVAPHNEVNYAEHGDYLINHETTIGIGGKNKAGTQIQDIENAYLAVDDTIVGAKNRIPLWLFGFGY